MQIEGFSGGEMPVLDARAIPKEALAEAINCMYSKDQLYMGRYGLSLLADLSQQERISNMLEGPDGLIYLVHHPADADLASVSRVLSDGSVETLHTTYPWARLAKFRDVVLIMDGIRPLMEYDVITGELTARGGIYCGMDFETTDVPVNFGTDYVGFGVFLFRKRYYREIKIVRCRAVGFSQNVKCNVRAYSYSDIIAEIPLSYVVDDMYIFEPTEPITLEPDRAYYVLVEDPSPDPTGGPIKGVPHENGDIYIVGTLNTFEYAVSFSFDINWDITVKPKDGVQVKSRMFFIDKQEFSDEMRWSRILYSAPNDLDDFSYAGGHFTFGDDPSSEANAIAEYDGKLLISGTVRGKLQTLVYNVATIQEMFEEYAISFGTRVPDGLKVLREKLYILGDNWIGVYDKDLFGRKTVADVSSYAVPQESLTRKSCMCTSAKESWVMVHNNGIEPPNPVADPSPEDPCWQLRTYVVTCSSGDAEGSSGVYCVCYVDKYSVYDHREGSYIEDEDKVTWNITTRVVIFDTWCDTDQLKDDCVQDMLNNCLNEINTALNYLSESDRQFFENAYDEPAYAEIIEEEDGTVLLKYLSSVWFYDWVC